MTLSELIATLEVAPAPSHALNTAIWAIAYKGYPVRWEDGKPPEFLVDACYCSNRHERGASHWQSFSSGGSGPSYSSSLDAAYKLVPDDHRLMLSNRSYEGGAYLGPGWQATIHHPVSSGGGPKWKGRGPTGALAICIAALKALEFSRQEQAA